MKRLIIRFENEDGEGIYRNTDFDIQDVEYAGMRHPIPWDDELLIKTWCELDCADQALFKFGFNSVSQMRTWFYSNHFFTILEQNEFGMSVYEVEDDYVYDGHTQAVFCYDEAYRMEYFPDIKKGLSKLRRAKKYQGLNLQTF